ncbi:MAG: NADH-quinone oxidoreductase subunit J [Magnetococcales bacterium]|nr:NADH-quinone oxidoreductase subunit J [Magnetococcales bacterium]
MIPVADIVFYLLAAVLVIAALRVVTTRNPVHSALFLVLTFFTAAGLFVLLRAEFLAAILVMVYMGAVAVLFLFVVMMLDVDFAELRRGALSHLPVGLAVGGVILVELIIVALAQHSAGPVTEPAVAVPNTLAIGRVLYTTYLLPFEIASLVLLVAMIGAIVLTLRKRPDVRKQVISHQLARTRDQAVELKKVASGEGA